MGAELMALAYKIIDTRNKILQLRFSRKFVGQLTIRIYERRKGCLTSIVPKRRNAISLRSKNCDNEVG